MWPHNVLSKGCEQPSPFGLAGCSPHDLSFSLALPQPTAFFSRQSMLLSSLNSWVSIPALASPSQFQELPFQEQRTGILTLLYHAWPPRPSFKILVKISMTN